MTGVTFHRLAQRELAEAFESHDSESPGLGERFLDEVEFVLAILLRHPEAGPQTLGPLRRFVLPKFSYNLLYRPVQPGLIRVLAVAHQKQDPQSWVGRQ